MPSLRSLSNSSIANQGQEGQKGQEGQEGQESQEDQEDQEIESFFDNFNWTIKLLDKLSEDELKDIPKKIRSILQTIYICICRIIRLPTDINKWERSKIALIQYDANEYFGNALNILKSELSENIIKYIKLYNITNEQVDDFKNKRFKGDLVRDKTQVPPKLIGTLLKKLLIWNLDNPYGTFEEACNTISVDDLIKEEIPIKNNKNKNKPIRKLQEPTCKLQEPRKPNIKKTQIDFITNDGTITYDLTDTEKILTLLINHFGELKKLICLDLHGVADLYNDDEVIPCYLPKCIISYIGGNPETISSSIKAMKIRLDNDEILLGIIVYKKDTSPILGTKGWFISQIMDINKELNITFIDDGQANVDCVNALEHDMIQEHRKITTYFIDKSKSPKETLTTILSNVSKL